MLVGLRLSGVHAPVRFVGMILAFVDHNRPDLWVNSSCQLDSSGGCFLGCCRIRISVQRSTGFGGHLSYVKIIQTSVCFGGSQLVSVRDDMSGFDVSRIYPDQRATDTARRVCAFEMN